MLWVGDALSTALHLIILKWSIHCFTLYVNFLLFVPEMIVCGLGGFLLKLIGKAQNLARLQSRIELGLLVVFLFHVWPQRCDSPTKSVDSKLCNVSPLLKSSLYSDFFLINPFCPHESINIPFRFPSKWLKLHL